MSEIINGNLTSMKWKLRIMEENIVEVNCRKGEKDIEEENCHAIKMQKRSKNSTETC